VTPALPTRNLLYEVTNRPYPSGGATYDTEIYLTIDRCEGVSKGIYHYHPLHHALYRLAEPNRYVESIIADAMHSAALDERPQVVITLASRFQRLSWKYRSIAYATVLKNAGVLYEAMYLVATAMGLSLCALGAGNSEMFGRAAGLDPLVESSVGELIRGSTTSS
jgi:SagB-type dehydrogenase family enzyme